MPEVKMTKPKAKKYDQSTTMDEQSVDKQTLTAHAASATVNNETMVLFPVLTAIQASLQAMDKLMNDRFNSIENTLLQMQASLSETIFHISELEGARVEQDRHISELEALCQHVVAANKGNTPRAAPTDKIKKNCGATWESGKKMVAQLKYHESTITVLMTKS